CRPAAFTLLPRPPFPSTPPFRSTGWPFRRRRAHAPRRPPRSWRDLRERGAHFAYTRRLRARGGPIHRHFVSLSLVAFRHFAARPDRKSTRLNSSHVKISYAVFCL